MVKMDIAGAILALINTVERFILPAAYALLPSRMQTPEATAMLLAIGLQESRFEHRTQVVNPGVEPPARGFWQFEAGGGVRGVLTHPASRHYLQTALRLLSYSPDTDTKTLHRLITDNDVLAAVCARLLLWTDYRPIPGQFAGAEAAWQCYIRNWRPGKPHRETWDAFHAEAWTRVLTPRG